MQLLNRIQSPWVHKTQDNCSVFTSFNQSIISLPLTSILWHRRQVTCGVIAEALMREPAAGWNCQDSCCLAGLMTVSWDYTLMSQRAGEGPLNHDSASFWYTFADVEGFLLSLFLKRDSWKLISLKENKCVSCLRTPNRRLEIKIHKIMV